MLAGLEDPPSAPPVSGPPLNEDEDKVHQKVRHYGVGGKISSLDKLGR